MTSDYLIVANGPFLAKDIIAEASQNKIIVALDGAAMKLQHRGLKPQVIIGDFDSITENEKQYLGIHHTNEQSTPYPGKHDTLIVPAYDQNFSDLEKAIHYCDKENAKSITIVCATAGRLDHHEHVMNILRMHYKKNRPMLLHTEQQTLRYAQDETIKMSGEAGDKCGISATFTGKITTTGLVYDSTEKNSSLCNILQGSHASITITGGALLIMPPQLKSQREFMKKSDRERLEILLRES